MTLRVITFKIDEELLTKLDLYCVNNRLYRSEVIREAIEFYLKFKRSVAEENYVTKMTTREL